MGSIGRGEYPIAPLDIVKTVLGIDTGNPEHSFVINTLRLPGTLVAFLVGVAFAISGTIFQGLTCNPLADPSIIGIMLEQVLLQLQSLFYFRQHQFIPCLCLLLQVLYLWLL